MTLEEVFASEDSNFKFQLLVALYSGIARQQKWVIDFVNWSLGAAGIYATTLIANLDKLRPLLKPNWFSWAITFLFLSAFIGVVTRLVLAWSDSVLQLQVEMETQTKEWFKHLDNQKPDWEFVRTVGQNVFKMTIESAKIVASKQPWPLRRLSEWTIKKLENQMEIGLKRCFQIYWLSLWTLVLQISFLALAILWPLIRLKAHVH
jgi:hypothetical protein